MCDFYLYGPNCQACEDYALSFQKAALTADSERPKIIYTTDSFPVIFIQEMYGTEKGSERAHGKGETKEEGDWEILSRKVVPRVEKLCAGLSATFFAIDWFPVLSLLFECFSVFCWATVSVLSRLGIWSKMASNGGDDSTCWKGWTSLSTNLVFMVSCEMTRSEFSVYIKIKIQSFQSKDIESRLHQVLAEASFNFSQMMMLILI